MTGSADGFGLAALRSRYAAGLDGEIDAWIGRLGYPAEFPGMLRYQMGYVDQRLRPASHPGKRVRPLLCLAIAEAFSGSNDLALPAAAAIELLHNFSLIHDDIEDRDPSRHHRATVWKVWGEAQGINAGDAMFAVAVRAVASAPHSPAGQMIVEQFADTALALTKGQYLDMSFEERHQVTPHEYMEMISLKSAALIGFSAWAGATLGGAGEEQRSLLYDFGEKLGLAFQIHDDINGVWGDAERTGKVPHTDLFNRKKSFPVLIALSRAGSTDEGTLEAFYRRQNDDVGAVLRALEETDARAASQQELERHLSAAHERLRKARLSPTLLGHLKAITLEVTGQREATS